MMMLSALIIVFACVSSVELIRRPEKKENVDREKVRENARDQFIAMWNAFDWTKQDKQQDHNEFDDDLVATNNLKNVKQGRRGGNGLSGEDGASGQDGTNIEISLKPNKPKKRQKQKKTTTVAIDETKTLITSSTEESSTINEISLSTLKPIPSEETKTTDKGTESTPFTIDSKTVSFGSEDMLKEDNLKISNEVGVTQKLQLFDINLDKIIDPIIEDVNMVNSRANSLFWFPKPISGSVVGLLTSPRTTIHWTLWPTIPTATTTTTTIKPTTTAQITTTVKSTTTTTLATTTAEPTTSSTTTMKPTTTTTTTTMEPTTSSTTTFNPVTTTTTTTTETTTSSTTTVKPTSITTMTSTDEPTITSITITSMITEKETTIPFTAQTVSETKPKPFDTTLKPLIYSSEKPYRVRETPLPLIEFESEDELESIDDQLPDSFELKPLPVIEYPEKQSENNDSTQQNRYPLPLIQLDLDFDLGTELDITSSTKQDISALDNIPLTSTDPSSTKHKIPLTTPDQTTPELDETTITSPISTSIQLDEWYGNRKTKKPKLTPWTVGRPRDTARGNIRPQF